MAADRDELIAWLQSLPKGCDVAVDEGGLTLVELGDDNETLDEFDVGGIPLPED